MKNKQYFALIILLVIGFASISTTLIIKGNAKIEANLDDFDVIFIEALLDGESSPNVEIDSSKKRLTFTTNELISIGDTARLDYKIKNTSTQYDADVIINCNTNGGQFLIIKSSFDGKKLPLTDSINIGAQDTKNGSIDVELIKLATENVEISITCDIELSAKSRTNYIYSLIFDSNGGTNVEDKAVEYNTSYGSLSIPEKDGYIFIGWFNENDERVDEATVLDIKGNKDLTAKWAEKAYPLTIVKNYPDKSEKSEINIPYGNSVNTLINIEDGYFIENIQCTEGYSVKNYNKEVVIYGDRTLNISNNKKPANGTCTLSFLQGIYEYSYTGTEQKVEIPYEGDYKFELWGAGIDNIGDSLVYGGGKGSYTSGNLKLQSNEELFIYVGGISTNSLGGYNGGGSSNSSSYFRSGSGATDIRLKKGQWNDKVGLRSRIMVSAGAGNGSHGGEGAPGGGLIGYSGIPSCSRYAYGYGGSQVSGGSAGTFDWGGSGPTSGIFGVGGIGNSGYGGGGGGGYYGGGGSGVYQSSCGGAGSGSSFISGHVGCIAIKSANDQTPKVTAYSKIEDSYHYSGYVFTNTVMIDGAGYNWTNKKESYTGMPSHDGTSTMTGNSGNGYAKITYLGN